MARDSSWMKLFTAADACFDRVRIEVNQRFALTDAADANTTFEARPTSGSTIVTVQPRIHRSCP